ncbi:hypothetical protein [Planotetraspora phitsanulokensis]|uniref:hypothetical protein n=1 Tax=Planotetraspora phitsanulokensis TaxID=575192 RepID=UPI00194DB015|nr:hypothetical protein [Planotetraspora phitsanulokensis]
MLRGVIDRRPPRYRRARFTAPDLARRVPPGDALVGKARSRTARHSAMPAVPSSGKPGTAGL